MMLIPSGHNVKEISSENQEVIDAEMGFFFKHIGPPPESSHEQKEVTDSRPIVFLVSSFAIVWRCLVSHCSLAFPEFCAPEACAKVISPVDPQGGA